MNQPLRRSLSLVLAVVSLCLAHMAWARPLAAQTVPETIQAIDKARISTRILFITAHPDDETAGMLAYLSRGLYADVALLTITRGQGGQNAVGPEQDAQLGVIRTTELLAADRQYGVRQFFTRAVDPGFSKSPERSMKIWGDQIPLEDMVRVIRTFRPEIVINGWGGVHNGHGQHQASGILTPKAVEAAADPKMFPEQISEGLPAWKVMLELRQEGMQAPGAQQPFKPSAAAVQLPVADVSELWGESYAQMGADGHEAHRSQGTPALFGNAFFRRAVYLVEDKDKGAQPFDAKSLAEPISALEARFPVLRGQMDQPLATADQDITAAAKSVLALDRAAAAKSLADAGKQIEGLQAEVAKSSGDETASASWELARVRERIDLALSDDVALPVAAQADRHELVAGEELSVEVIAGRPAVPIKYEVTPSCFVAPGGWKTMPVEAKPAPATPGRGPAANNPKFDISIPAGATAPSAPGDVILPFPPPLVKLSLGVSIDDYKFTIEKPVQSQVAKTTGVETYELEMVPAVTLTPNPAQIMLPQKKAAAAVTLFARVRYHGTQPAKVSVGVDTPAGWQAQPLATLEFKEAGDQLIRFTIMPPPHVPLGAYPLHPYAKIAAETFRTSLEPIPTLPTRDWAEPDDAAIHVADLLVPAGLRIGYVAADNDPIPEDLRQIGIQVDMLDEVALAFGDLSHYDAIVAGIRAYELRPDLMRMNPRVFDYVRNGGTLLVQYQRDFAWNKLLPGPFPVKMADTAARVTDANSPVRFIAPNNPILNTPNKITMEDFQGWVQERGLYFLDKLNPPYEAVLGLKDFNEPETLGGMVYARDGKGVYMYTGLSFFRQLPAGTPGAYRLFVNLLSQTRHAK